MSNAKQMTSAYDMHDDGSLSLWNYAHQPRETKAVPRTQLSIMRSRLEAVTASHAPNYVAKQPSAQPQAQTKLFNADHLSFHASPVFKNEETIERVLNVLLIMTALFVVAWLSVSILTNNGSASRHSMMDMSWAEPPASTGFAPMAAANFLPDVGENIDLGQMTSAPTAMHMPVPPPSLEAIEAMEADEGAFAAGAVNGWDSARSPNQFSFDQLDI